MLDTTKSTKANLGLFLNLHLPYISPLEEHNSIEKNWLFSAISNTYLPLLRMLNQLNTDNVPSRMTLSLSPTLLDMLANKTYQEEYTERLSETIKLAQKEVLRTKENPALHSLAQYYLECYQKNYNDFTILYKKNIIPGFKDLYDKEAIGLITTCATHCTLPLFNGFPLIQELQIEIGIQSFQHYFGRAPRGFWLPECAYSPGLETYFKKKGISYFYSSAHAILNSSEPATRSTYAPVLTPNKTAVFCRDRRTSRSIWSTAKGFPGDSKYRDFYRDLISEQKEDYLGSLAKPFLKSNTGFKYYNNNGDIYDIPSAKQEIEKHVSSFLSNRLEEIEELTSELDYTPYLNSLYDAEIFGHYWFEGIDFLDCLFRQVAIHPSLSFITPSDYLMTQPKLQILEPAFSSWGQQGFMQNWLNGSNKWIYRHLHLASMQLEDILKNFYDSKALTKRTLLQVVKELLLAQSSDWPFILSAGPNTQYASIRLKEHLCNFRELYELLGKESKPIKILFDLEERNNVFPFLTLEKIQHSLDT